MKGQAGNTIWTRNFICILLGNFLSQLANFSTSTLVSTYATFLGAGPTLMGFLTGMYFGVALAMRPAAGPIQTRVSHRKLLLFVFAMGCVVNAGYAMFHSISAFLLFRVLHGIQYAFIGSLTVTIAADSVPQEKLASGMGIFGASGAIAQTIAPQFGIMLCDWGAARAGEDFGYTLLFLFSVLVMFLSLIPTFALQETERERTVSVTGKWYQNIISRHALAPALTMMLIIMGNSTLSGYMVPFGREELGIENIGIFFTMFAGIMLVIRPLSGTLTDRLGLRKMLIPAIALFFAAFLILGTAHGMTAILLGAFVAALGYGTSNPAMQALTVQTEPRARRAVTTNTLCFGMDIGFFVGPLLGGIVRDLSGNFRSVILCGGIPLALAMLVFLLTWPASARRIAEVKALETAAESAE